MCFYNSCNDWIFGHLNYDLKNEIESFQSKQNNQIDFPVIFLFQPKTVITLNGNYVDFYCFDDAAAVYETINKIVLPGLQLSFINKKIESAFTKNEYIKTIEQLKKHIHNGDCYEVNFCQEFFINYLNTNALQTYFRLLEISPSPFSCYYKLYDNFLLCASPERFISKK